MDVTLIAVSLVTLSLAGVTLFGEVRRGEAASPASVYSALAVVHFALPGLLLGSRVGPLFVYWPNLAYAREAAVFAAVGLGAVVVGSRVALAGTPGFRTLPPHLPRHEWADRKLLLAVLTLATLGWATRAYVIAQDSYFQHLRGASAEIATGQMALVRFGEQLPVWVMLSLCIRSMRNTKFLWSPWGIAAVCAVIAELAYYLPTGRKEDTLLALLLPAFAWTLRRRQAPSLKLLASLAVGFILLIPTTHRYRSELERQSRGTGMLDRTLEAAAQVTEPDSPSRPQAMDIVVNRLSLLEPISACIRLRATEAWSPPFGDPYLGVIYGLVPRAVWPEKPNLHYGTEFGIAAGFLGANEMATSVSVTFPGEAYLAYGWGGVTPLFALGVAFGLTYRLTQTGEHQETAILTYLIVLPTTLYVGGTCALYFGGLLKAVPAAYLLGCLLESGNGARVSRNHLRRGA